MPLEKLSERIRGKQDAVGGESSRSTDPGVTDKMPVVPHKVLHTDIPFYTDEACTLQVPDARITILRPLDPDGFDELEVVPSRKHYQVGQYLNWMLCKENLWEENYYRNPETGQVEQAWSMHVEFVGEVISPQALEADRERIQQLETLYEKADTSTVM